VALKLAGTPAELGRQHGVALSERIHAFLNDDLCRLNRILQRPTTRDQLKATINCHGEAIARDLPDSFAEIAGLAAGAGIDLSDALLLQIRREVLGFSRLPSVGDCTTLCRLETDGAVLAQTIDLNGHLDDQMAVLTLDHANSGRRVLVITFTGLLGYLGLNSDGLAVGLNLVLGGSWQGGVPPYLAIRHLLDSCSDLESCLDRLGELRLASSRALTICDRRQAAWVEVLDGRIAVMRGNHLAHTNHFLSSDFAAEDALNPFARISSVKRLDACWEGLAALGEEADPDTVMAIFTRAPIRVAGTADIRRERTVGAVVMRPSLGELHVRRGDPALAPTEVFSVD
jgi:hypothetical protein